MRRLFIVICALAAMWVGLTRGAMEGLIPTRQRNIIYVHVPSSITAQAACCPAGALRWLCWPAVVNDGSSPPPRRRWAWSLPLCLTSPHDLVAPEWGRGGRRRPSPLGGNPWFLCCDAYPAVFAAGFAQRRLLSAVFAVIAFLDVPMVIYSVSWPTSIGRTSATSLAARRIFSTWSPRAC